MRKVHDEAFEDENARPYLQFGPRMCFRPLGFAVAFGTSQTVDDGQLKCQGNMEQQCPKQHNLKGFHDMVADHEIAESVVPSTAVVAQNAEVGAGVEKQEKTEKCTQKGNEDFLRDGMDFGDVP